MGVIKKQSISGSIYSYIGVGLGFISTGLLYPRIFSTEEVGLLRILVSYSTLFAMFAGMGFSTVTVKLFPYFRTKDEKHHGFLGLSLLIALIGFAIATSAYLLLRTNIVEHAEGKSELFVTYFYYVIPLIFFTLLFNVFDNYYRVLYNAVKGIIVKEVVMRITILTVIILYYLKVIDLHQTIILYTFALILPSILLFISLIKNNRFPIIPDFAFLDKDLRQEMMTVGFFGLLSSFSGMLLINIDVLMVDRMLGLSAVGIYTITFFFGTLIVIPMRTMGKISSVVIADAWKRGDTETIGSIYKKSSISLSIIGLLLFIGIWGNIDNIFIILPAAYLPGKMVIFYIGIANLIETSLGVSAHVIMNSKYYKYLSYFLLIFAVLIIITNLLAIPVYGIVGAAIASLISRIIYNLIKYIFIYKKFGYQQFSMKYLLLIAIGFAAWFISTLMPALPNFVFDIVVRSAIITTVFAIPVYYFKISEDLNERLDSLFSDLKKRF